MYKDGFYRHRIVAIFAIIMIVAVGLAVIPSKTPTQTQTKSAKFVIASWTFPADEYGQGLWNITFFENSTGSWTQVQENGLPLWVDYTDSGIVELNESEATAYKLRVYSFFNSTFYETPPDGRIYQRHDVAVTHLDAIIFSQQNFTWIGTETGAYAPMWVYWYDVVLNFIPVAGQIYTVVINYELFY